MAYSLKDGETIEDAAWEMLGDRRLTSELQQWQDKVYLKDFEQHGPPSPWLADPSRLRSK